jgi:hypothetical protein
MREAAVPGYRLSKAKFSTRLLTSFAMIGLLLGLSTAALMTLVKTGLDTASVQRYYLGAAVGEAGADAAGDTEALFASGPRPLAELAEVTHLHLMGGSLLLFLLCHLLSVCDVSDRIRSVIYTVSFTSFLATFGLPWVIVYLSPKAAILFGPAAISFLVTLVALCIIPLREMWGRR